jgi:hypothetical protein
MLRYESLGFGSLGGNSLGGALGTCKRSSGGDEAAFGCVSILRKADRGGDSGGGGTIIDESVVLLGRKKKFIRRLHPHHNQNKHISHNDKQLVKIQESTEHSHTRGIPIGAGGRVRRAARLRVPLGKRRAGR